MARKAGQGKEEEESRARQQKEKTPVRHEEKKPACHGGAHHVVEQEWKTKERDIMANKGTRCDSREAWGDGRVPKAHKDDTAVD
ncbi:hypothetical protein STEG23_031343 [Scotinomys teguina]